MRAVSLLGGVLVVCMIVACSDDDDDDDDRDDDDRDRTVQIDGGDGGVTVTPDGGDFDSDISTVEGRLDLATFAASAPTGVDAINGAGARVNSPLGADGAFKLTLAKDQSYELVVLTPAGEVPIVHPRDAARIVRNFYMDDGNMALGLGVVRRLDRAPDGGFTVALAPATCAPGVPADPDDDTDDVLPPEKDADAAQPFALPEFAAPAKVAGCED